jgi:hypothetical protein
MALTRARAEEFRRKAQECFDLARAISLETERAILIDIAQTYLQLVGEQRRAGRNHPTPCDRAASGGCSAATADPA